MKTFGVTLGLLAALGSGIAALPSTAMAQAQSGQSGVQSLPPALRAAVISGNEQAISQALATLSGGNATTRANLASQVIQAAEGMLASNPQAAVSAASAAVGSIQSTQVSQSAPRQTETVLTTAARIFVNPAVQQAVPERVAQLAGAAMQTASSTNNSSLIATISAGAITTAEKILTVNPTAAVQLASTAVQSVQSQAVQNQAPTQVMQVVSAASRIIVNPSAQQVAPQAVATIAVGVTAAVSNPSVYQSSPAASVQVMAQAYAAATSQAVATASPTTAQQIVSQLTSAAQNTQLSQANPTNSSQINEILAGKGLVTTTETVIQPPVVGTDSKVSPS